MNLFRVRGCQVSPDSDCGCFLPSLHIIFGIYPSRPCTANTSSCNLISSSSLSKFSTPHSFPHFTSTSISIVTTHRRLIAFNIGANLALGKKNMTFVTIRDEFLEYARTENSTASKGTAEKIVDALSFIQDVVTYVWIGLSVLMLISIGLVYFSVRGPERRTRQVLAIVSLVVLVAATWTYPFYSGGFGENESLTRILYSNYAYSGLLVLVIIIVGLFQIFPALLLLPVVVWVTIATIYTVAKIKSNP